MTKEEKMTKEWKLTKEKTREKKMTREEKMTKEKMAKEEKITREVKMAEEEKMTREVKMAEEEKFTKKDKMTKEDKITKEVKMAEEEKITREVRMAEEEKMTENDKITRHEEITIEKSSGSNTEPCGTPVFVNHHEETDYQVQHTVGGHVVVNFSSLDEGGVYDLPAVIDYILEKTGKEKIIYVGHSMGTTVFYIMMSQRPEYNEKITVMISLGAIAYASHSKKFMGNVIAYLSDPVSVVAFSIKDIGVAKDNLLISEDLLPNTRRVQKCRQFSEGRQSVHDEERSGRPSLINDDRVELVRQCIMENRRFTIMELSSHFPQISRSLFHEIVTKHLLFKKVCVPDMDFALHPKTKHQSMHWRHSGSPVRTKFKQTLSVRKVMCTVFWDRKGILLIDFLPRGETVNADHYCETLRKLRRAIQNKRRGMLIAEVVLLHDNARPHTARRTAAALTEFGWELFDHPPYSPDLAPSDFHVFLHLRKFLSSGEHFGNDEELKTSVTRWFHSQAAEFYDRGIQKLIPRYDKYLNSDGGNKLLNLIGLNHIKPFPHALSKIGPILCFEMPVISYICQKFLTSVTEVDLQGINQCLPTKLTDERAGQVLMWFESMVSEHPQSMQWGWIIHPGGGGGLRKRGRPRLRWLQDVEDDLRRVGCKRWRQRAQDRDEWFLLIKEAQALHGL
ncbi:hypothetical protein ANN_03737 [Periplaneta americana]|uniref:AB hydrolase-1 domain-containing protein n=1 Tax=Periplaneta americana TaxID=6978 RepID=A0ABQ8TZQ1_PERAM|nr:hypothetical protein ANN_03737 [Periplaneta americana]